MAPRLSRVDSGQPAETKVSRADGWSNQITGLGTKRDKRVASTFRPDLFTQPELELMYRGNDMAARIVDEIPNEMVRMGFEVLSDDKEGAEAVAAAAGQGNDDSDVQALDVLGMVHTALKWQRAYGGGALLLGVDDGQTPDKPLDEKRIKSFTWMTALTPEELQPAARYSNALGRKYGQPQFYRLVPIITSASSIVAGVEQGSQKPLSYNTLVHESRVIAFQGIEVSRRQQAQSYNFGWGDSVLARAWRVIRDFDMSWEGAAHLLQDFSQGVLKMKGLYDVVVSEDPKAQNGVANRMLALDMMRSLARMMVVDADSEDFERKTTPLSGYPELLDRFCNRLSATSETPVTRLMGLAPAGLNATGDADMRTFFDRVEFRRTRTMKPALARILRLLMLSKAGPTSGKLLERWSVRLPSLWQMDALQSADVRLKTAQADEIEIRNQVTTPEEVAQSRHGGDEWSSHTSLDTELRESMAATTATEPADPEDPGLALPDPVAVDPKAALQGPQTLAMLQVVQAVVAKTIPRDAGVQMLLAAFPITAEEAEKVMGTAGQGFEPAPKAAPVAGLPPGPGQKPAIGPVEVGPHTRGEVPVESHIRAPPDPEGGQ